MIWDAALRANVGALRKSDGVILFTSHFNGTLYYFRFTNLTLKTCPKNPKERGQNSSQKLALARLAAPDPEAIDLGLLLDELSQQRAFSDQSAAIQTLRHDLNDHILQIFNAASQSEKSGLSIRVSELLRMSR